MSEYTMRLPDVGEGVAEAEIVEWHIAVGDRIDEDDVIAEVMSDKATVELSSPVGGTVRWIAGDVGDMIAVGSDFVRFDLGGDTLLPPPSAVAEVAEVAEVATRSPVRHTAAAPAVRARARALGIDLDDVAGTGPEGRVLHGDLDARLRAAPEVSGAPCDDRVDEIPVVGLRRNIAERMSQSVRTIPHFTYVEEVDVTALEQLRRDLNAEHADRGKLSLLPFLARAIVIAVRAHPEMNARFDDGAGVVRRHRAVHLGVATQTERGLMVPVVEHAESLDLWATSAEVARLAEVARAATITLDELVGSTITVTSLGALGGIVSTPIINAPEVAIIGVNKIADRAVVLDGSIVQRKIMNLSSSFDHRVIDGADAASFIQLIRRLLEAPARLFIDER